MKKFFEKGTLMQDKKPTIKENERDVKTLSMIILEQFENHKIVTILMSLFLFLIASSIVLFILIIIIPSLFVNDLVHHYNDTNIAGIHVTASSNFLIAFVTLLSVVVTTVYVFLTYELVSETRQMRNMQTDPDMSLFLEPRDQHNEITDLFIQNIGLGSAYKINLEVLSDYIYGVWNLDNKGMLLPEPKILYASKALIIKDGIDYLAPTQKKRLFSTMFFSVKDLNLKNNLDNHLRIYVTFKDKFGKEKKQNFTISFYEVPANGIGEFSTFERKFIDELDDIKTEINSISKKIENLNNKSDD